jgi:hypothetical protein
MQLAVQNFNQLNIDRAAKVEILIDAEVFANLGYEHFDGSHVEAPATAIAQLPALADFYLAGYGVIDTEQAKGVVIRFKREEFRHYPRPLELPTYHLRMTWEDYKTLGEYHE